MELNNPVEMTVTLFAVVDGRCFRCRKLVQFPSVPDLNSALNLDLLRQLELTARVQCHLSRMPDLVVQAISCKVTRSGPAASLLSIDQAEKLIDAARQRGWLTWSESW